MSTNWLQMFLWQIPCEDLPVQLLVIVHVAQINDAGSEYKCIGVASAATAKFLRLLIIDTCNYLEDKLLVRDEFDDSCTSKYLEGP
jgi:hypothetical protein